MMSAAFSDLRKVGTLSHQKFIHVQPSERDEILKNDLPPVPRPHGPWQIKSSKTEYSDPWVRLRRDEVIRPDGSIGSYAVVTVKYGICVVPIDEQGVVHLTQEFHYAVGRVTLEGVSGGIEVGHDASETAHRELQEELGIEAKQLELLGTTDPFTGSVISPTALFVAHGLSFGIANPETTEQITHVRMPLDDAIAAVIDGTITHAPTCIILLRLGLSRNQPSR
jgi:ADP-ribose pyrophosphatase